MLPMIPGSIVGRASPAQGFGVGQFSSVDERRDGEHWAVVAFREREIGVERRRGSTRV